MPILVYVLPVFLILIIASRIFRDKVKLPPGPPGLPFVGNIFDLNAQEAWRKANKWGKQFGGIVCLNIVGTSFLIIERGEVAIDLLHKRGRIYSDRHHMTMAGMCGLDAIVPLTRNDRLKSERKLLDQALSPSAVMKWRPALRDNVLILLQNIVQQPDRYVEHFNRLSGSNVLRAVYGYHAQAHGDPLVRAAEEMNKVVSTCMESGWLVNFLPFRGFLIAQLISLNEGLCAVRWIPGNKWQKLANKWRSSITSWTLLPFETFKSLPESYDKRASFCNTLLENHGEYEEERVMWIASSLYAGAVDTSVATLTQFILAMVLHPDSQRRAQEEIDRVVGSGRLPDFEDRDKLPFMDCILKEVLRWGTPVPLILSHRLIEADSYNDMRFPEGTLLSANIWSMLHDERVYEEPLEFRPERFLATSSTKQTGSSSLPPSDPYTYVFGFGRRRCPGIHFVHQSLWLTMTSMLSCFDILPIVDAEGTVNLPEVAFDGGLFRHPKPFKCLITLRSEHAHRLLQQSVE